MAAAEQVTAACAHHAEGPVWDPATALLHWVDMLAGDVLTMDPGDGRIRRVHVGDVAAAVRPRSHGGLVVAVERGFGTLDPHEQAYTPLVELWTDPGVRMNEGGCDPQGRFYCGSMAYDESPGRGTLYCLDTDRTARRVLGDVTISNGIVWSLDGAQVYYVDTPTHRIDVFDHDPATGELSDRRPLVHVDPEHGAPDGLTQDADGGLWVALWGGGAVHRYTLDGRLDAVVEVGPRQVTACTFAGPGLTDLYITTSRDKLSAPEPAAGALFRYRPGVRGTPVRPYGG
jgi:sugar lactone lactonase YvrE